MPLKLEGDAKARIDAIVADYADHPALLAYYVVDEPTASAFPALGEVVAYLKQRDPKHPGYINLFPTYAAPGSQLGTGTYVEYVERFVNTVKPFVISFDHYPFISTGDRPDFFENLAVIRNAAIKHDLGFWNIVLCTQHYDYRHLTEGELRFQAMQTLAYGGKGLLWYTYWYPGPANPTVKHAMINHDGTRNPHFEMIKRINGKARAMGNELMEARCWATFHSGEPVLHLPPKQRSPVEPTGPGMLTTGVFVHRDRNYLAVIANRDHRSAIETRVRVEPASAAVERFDPATGEWSAVARDRETQVLVRAEPGGAVLLRWR
jgi:hypothetical protein